MVNVQAISVRISEGATLALHAAIALAGGLVAIRFPLVGAAICLMAAFSFYSERALGAPLLGAVLPKRASQNVLSPPPGPAWEDVEIVFTAGYDLERSYPVGEWLSRRFSGRFTTDRLLFWGGLVPVFLATMLYVATIDGTGTRILQLLGSTVLLVLIAAQFDARLTGDPESDEADLQATRDLLASFDELNDDPAVDPPVAVCFFGAETVSAAGAAAFFGRRRDPVSDGTAVVNFVNGEGRGEGPLSGPPTLLTAREGDLATLRMSYELGSDSPLKPQRAILRRTTTALIARRRGHIATTIVGRGETAADLGLDLVEKVFEDNEESE